MIEKKSAIAKKRYSFKRALGHIPSAMLPETKLRLREVMGISNASTWSTYLNQGFSPTFGVVLAVNEIFEDFGIHQPWDEITS